MATRVACWLSILAFLGCLTGCLGSPEPYRPGFQKRPEPEPLETAEERARRMAVPVEIERDEARQTQKIKALAKVTGSIPRNPWNRHEWDLDDTLRPLVRNGGPEMSAEAALGRPPVKRPLPEGAFPAKKEAKEEGGEGEGDEEEYEDE